LFNVFHGLVFYIASVVAVLSQFCDWLKSFRVLHNWRLIAWRDSYQGRMYFKFTSWTIRQWFCSLHWQLLDS